MKLSHKEAQIEADRMHDVLLLLDHLAMREEATIKIILDCLYDIGSIYLINQRTKVRPLKGLLNGIARLSKPAFRFFALRWFQSTCPQLIANWLHAQVKFGTPSQDDTNTIEIVHVQDTLPERVQQQATEIKTLRTRIKWLTGALISIAALWGSTLMLGR
ncbi:hypothetical protein XM38_038060 [Halomicronema hongdechloris C2206]|uniref:Uncharacterized protein n=1 Tax=Halomicronema hongdechloris C2206 TaxID=1641165 RepID=A0A1Z3HRG9_9CYAN|nr:hypothetical protein [Halomicronema hongdechloris]ASC72846.1 hypothetical protein XM38_038060 [Halomicronema hongdechloris C2206]